MSARQEETAVADVAAPEADRDPSPEPGAQAVSRSEKTAKSGREGDPPRGKEKPAADSAAKPTPGKPQTAKSSAGKAPAGRSVSGKAPAAKSTATKPPAAKSVGWALVQAARLHRARVGDRLAALDLFAGQEQVVQALAAAGSMTMGDLAATLRVRPPTASKTISRLAALGFVERRAEAGDGRIVRVRLTETGLAKAEAIERIWDEVEAELLDDFEGKERRRLRKLLRRAARNLAEAAGVAGHEADPEVDAEIDGDDEAEPLLGPLASDAVARPPS